jgi:hypothetical protein
MGDLKSADNFKERVITMTETPQAEEVKAEEGNVADPSPAEPTTETPTNEVAEKKDELAELKSAVDKLKSENSQVKDAMQKRIDQLTWELKSTKEQSEVKREKTWDDLNTTELKDYIAHYADEGNGKMVAFLTDKLADKKITERLTETSSATQNATIRAKAWDEVVGEYSELKDPNSDLYKRTLEIVRSDKRFDDIKNFPEGHAVAARLASEQMLREKLKATETENKKISKKVRDEALKNSLDSSTARHAEVSTLGDVDKLMDRASNSKNPYGHEWKEVLRRINSVKK